MVVIGPNESQAATRSIGNPINQWPEYTYQKNQQGANYTLHHQTSENQHQQG